MKKSVQHMSIINVNNEYGTPKKLYDDACKQFHLNPILDVCAQFKNKKCDWYISEELNSLKKEWDDDFFMNPPYSEVKIWMKKAYEQHLKHNVDALILVFAKTDTIWWHDWVENKAEVHFIKGRIKFLDKNNDVTKYPAPYGSVWIIYRSKNNQSPQESNKVHTVKGPQCATWSDVE